MSVVFPTLDEITSCLLELDERLQRKDGQRFLDKIALGDAPAHAPHLGPCIVWTRALDTKGYGTFRGSVVDEGGRQIPAYLWLYRRLHGPVPDGQELHHECHDEWVCCPDIARDCPHRRCVRHVRPIARRENRARDTRAARNMRRALQKAREGYAEACA